MRAGRKIARHQPPSQQLFHVRRGCEADVYLCLFVCPHGWRQSSLFRPPSLRFTYPCARAIRFGLVGSASVAHNIVYLQNVWWFCFRTSLKAAHIVYAHYARVGVARLECGPLPIALWRVSAFPSRRVLFRPGVSGAAAALFSSY